MQTEGRPGGTRDPAVADERARRSSRGPGVARAWRSLLSQPVPGRARTASLALALGAAAAAAQATPCEQVMAPIEARIRAKGVADFRLEAVDRAASAPGVQVGTCDLGRKKILYLRGTPGSGAASSAAAAAARAGAERAAAPAGTPASGPRVITECADGRVIEQGSCKKK